VHIFRYRAARIDTHAGIISAPMSGEDHGRMIHAFEGAGVVEVPLSLWWRHRIVGVFRFPPKYGSLSHV
jgi:uncharacterized protein YijF (DUF1287 family)